MSVQRCKGSRDLSPDEMIRFRLIEGVFRDCCLKWGYEEVRTPILEYLHLFTSTGTLTPGMLGKVYSFLDWDGWSGERVVLRPDGTIPVARLYIDSMEDTELAKLFYIANVFIFEETGKKTRERWQCGVELMAGGSPVADVGLIMMASEVLNRLGLTDVELRLSHTGLIRGLLQKLELSPAEQTMVFDQILDGNGEALSRLKSKGPKMERALPLLLDLKGQSSGFLKNMRALLVQEMPEMEPSLGDFISIVDLLDALGYQYQIDITSGKGFEYYTGVTFHLFVGDEEVGGGGRYDALIPLMGGRDVPASGFALYLDRLMNLIKPESLFEAPSKRVMVRVEPGETALIKKGFLLAGRLREAGCVVELDVGGRQGADLRWTLDVREQSPQFVLTDRVENKIFEAQTADEVLMLLSD